VAVAVAVLGLIAAFATAPAWAAPGYEPDKTKPAIDLAGQNPHGIAIDQSNQRIYVALVTANENTFEPGQIEQLESNGIPTPSSPFKAGGAQDIFTGVAVNPVTQGVYASQSIFNTPFGNVGAWTMNSFSSSGVQGSSFALNNTLGVGPQIAADSTGSVYYPNDATNSVQVFNAAGVLQTSITCAACPGGTFSAPAVVAIGPSDSVYVVDLGTDRVVKLNRTGGSYTYASTVQSGKSAVAVAVDPTSGEVFVGDLPSSGYHVMAYDAAGVQFDDFGAGAIANPPFGPGSAGQIAVNATSGKLYVTEPVADVIRVFERVTIKVPTVTGSAASSIGQLTAKLNATVNANFHAVTDCDFQYTDDADFQANGYANADVLPCSALPAGSSNVQVNATATGLTPGATYHFRVVAANNGGSTDGNSLTFSALPAVAPTVTAEPASALTDTAATLSGLVNPHGGVVSDCHFELGTSISYGQSIPCLAAVGSGTTNVSQKLGVKDLTPETTYHFRLVVTSNAGTTNGDDSEFTTLPVPPPPPPPPPPAGPGPTVVAPPVTPPTVTPPARPLKCKKGFVKKKVRGKVRCVKRKKPSKRSR
jgi:hypothetical protein